MANLPLPSVLDEFFTRNPENENMRGYDWKAFRQMMDLLRLNPMLREFVGNFKDPKGFMWTRDPRFQQLLNLFYAGYDRQLDSGIVYLCRDVQFVANYGLDAFEAGIRARK